MDGSLAYACWRTLLTSLSTEISPSGLSFSTLRPLSFYPGMSESRAEPLTGSCQEQSASSDTHGASESANKQHDKIGDQHARKQTVDKNRLIGEEHEAWNQIMKSKPSKILICLNVKRLTPSEATVVSPKTASMKYSARCILTATAARGLEKKNEKDDPNESANDRSNQ